MRPTPRPAAGCPFAPWQRVRFGLLAGLVLGSLACQRQPSVVAAPTHPAAKLEVERFEQRPRLARLVRHGDPQAVLGMAVVFPTATPQSLILHRAAAHYLRLQLQEAGDGMRLQADSLGLRLLLPLTSPRAAKQLVQHLAATLQRAPSKADMAKLLPVLEPLRNFAVQHPSELWSAHCDGAVQIAAKELNTLLKPQRLADQLRGLLQVIHSRQIAISVVGSPALAKAVAEAHGSVIWPIAKHAGKASWPSDSTDDAFVDATAKQHRLRVTLWRPTANPEQSLVQQLASSDEPLQRHLAISGSWRLREVSATARGYGSCVKLTFTAKQDASPSTAASVLALLQSTLDHTSNVKQRPSDAQSAAPANAYTAAELSAWNALAREAHHKQRRLSVLRIAPQEPTERWHAHALRTYRQALTDPADPLEPTLTIRHRNEAGQGELHALVANPCASSSSSRRHHGSGLLAAMTAAFETDKAHLRVRAFAHGHALGLAGVDRKVQGANGAQARRLGRNLGKALSRYPLQATAFATQQGRALQDHRLDPLLEQWLNRLSASQPNILLALPRSQAVAALRVSDANTQWQRALEGPWRVAVLGNDAAQQAQTLAAELRRWLPPSSKRPCRPQLPKSGGSRLRVASDQLRGSLLLSLGQPSHQPSDIRHAKLSALFLYQRLRRALAGWTSVRLSSSSPGLGVVLMQLELERKRIDAALAIVETVIANTKTRGITVAEAQLAHTAYRHAELERLAEPQQRLYDLWQNGRLRFPPKQLKLGALQSWFNEASKENNRTLVAHKGESAKP